MRIRIRGRIAGVHVSEPVNRTVIRVAANTRTVDGEKAKMYSRAHLRVWLVLICDECKKKLYILN